MRQVVADCEVQLISIFATADLAVVRVSTVYMLILAAVHPNKAM